jgi:hypothetical protein
VSHVKNIVCVLEPVILGKITLTKTRKIRDIHDHSRSRCYSISSALEEFAVPLSLLLFANLSVMKIVAYDFTGPLESVEWAHDVMEGAREEAIQHPQAL